MRTLLALVLAELILFAPPLAMAQEPTAEPPTQTAEQTTDSSYVAGMLDGRASATEHYSSAAWFAGGFAGGFLLGLIGTAGMAVLSQTGRADPPPAELARVDSQPNLFRTGFLKGYDKKAKTRALRSSLIGGVLGTAVIVAVILSTQDEDDK